MDTMQYLKQRQQNSSGVIPESFSLPVVVSLMEMYCRQQLIAYVGDMEQLESGKVDPDFVEFMVDDWLNENKNK